jgi:S1-C subfamily serine protease
MVPPPTAFRGDTLERLSPRQVYNALSLGVEGTAMPSFSAAYTDQQRWDVAFFVPTLRVDFEPKRPAEDAGLSLEDLATHSNVELLNRLRARRPQASPGEVDWLRANLVSAPGAATALTGSDATSGGLAVALQLQDVFARVAERVTPRVVGVTGWVRDAAWSPEKLQAERGEAWMIANADQLRYPGFRPLRSGSGVLVDEGYVLSCDHLVRDDRSEVVQLVDVELPNQIHVASGVVGAEPSLDLAVLRLALPPTYDELPELEFGDSDRLQVGHWLIALGDPPGAQKVFAVGVVSAPPERQCYQEQASATLLQSSLVVPAGGLGGPVVDILGHVVGISIGKGTTTSTIAMGDPPPAARTLPINLVLNLFEALKVAQSQRSPWLGISVLELPLLRRRLGPAAQTKVFPPTGVYIDDVFDPSPASRAGVRPGDFLVGMGGHRIVSVADFQTWLYVLGVDKQAELDLVRDGKPLQSVATIEVRPASATTR